MAVAVVIYGLPPLPPTADFCYCEIVRLWDYEIVKLWDREIVRLWDLEIVRLWDCEVVRSWDCWDCEIVRIWPYEHMEYPSITLALIRINNCYPFGSSADPNWKDPWEGREQATKSQRSHEALHDLFSPSCKAMPHRASQTMWCWVGLMQRRVVLATMHFPTPAPTPIHRRITIIAAKRMRKRPKWH